MEKSGEERRKAELWTLVILKSLWLNSLEVRPPIHRKWQPYCFESFPWSLQNLGGKTFSSNLAVYRHGTYWEGHTVLHEYLVHWNEIVSAAESKYTHNKSINVHLLNWVTVLIQIGPLLQAIYCEGGGALFETSPEACEGSSFPPLWAVSETDTKLVDVFFLLYPPETFINVQSNYFVRSLWNEEWVGPRAPVI
jgi:hypothetical protein